MIFIAAPGGNHAALRACLQHQLLQLFRLYSERSQILLTAGRPIPQSSTRALRPSAWFRVYRPGPAGFF